MIERPIALVLGAGASKPYNFPTARELLTDVRYALTGLAFRQRLYGAGYSEAQVRDLAKLLAASHVGSLDGLLELPVHTGLVGVGKAAIAASLLQHELPQKLLPDAAKDDWYEHLFRRMLDKAPTLDAFLQNRVAFVTFNYDRSLEHFLLTTLCSTYGATPAEIAAAVSRNRLNIVHVYGSLGALPDLTTGPMSMPYGVDPNLGGILLKYAADSIHIAGEPGAQAGIDAAQSALMSCERICFLGFGYRPENVDRLELNTTLRKGASVFGSAYQSLPGERGDIKRMFGAAGHKITLAKSEAGALDALRRLPVLSSFDLPPT